MFPCFHRGCSGHDRELAAIYHTLEHLVATVDQIQQDFETFKTDSTTAFQTIQATVDELKTELAAALAGGVPAPVQVKLDALDAAILAADASLKPAPAVDGSSSTPSDASTPTDVPPAA